jgi:hypothetical protein
MSRANELRKFLLAFLWNPDINVGRIMHYTEMMI